MNNKEGFRFYQTITVSRKGEELKLHDDSYNTFVKIDAPQMYSEEYLECIVDEAKISKPSGVTKVDEDTFRFVYELDEATQLIGGEEEVVNMFCQCGSRLKKEHFSLDYPYFCPSCDENVYGIEAIEVSTNYGMDSISKNKRERLASYIGEEFPRVSKVLRVKYNAALVGHIVEVEKGFFSLVFEKLSQQDFLHVNVFAISIQEASDILKEMSILPSDKANVPGAIEEWGENYTFELAILWFKKKIGDQNE